MRIPTDWSTEMITRQNTKNKIKQHMIGRLDEPSS